MDAAIRSQHRKSAVNLTPMLVARTSPEQDDRRPLTIVVISCMRPHYLREVLLSLVPQVTKHDEVFLFQDGRRNPFSQRGVASEVIVDSCVSLFLSAFPKGRVFRSAENLGIAGNYRRAEQYVFEALNRPVGLFLEDDLVLAPNYLPVISDLIELALRNNRIGYVSAYGNFWASLEQQEDECGRLQRMHENWGAALTRSSWEAQKPVRERYWNLISDSDYKLRRQDLIRKLYANLGYNCFYTTQDSSRWIASLAAGMVRLTTATCHARYIGAIGEHSDNSFYNRHRFKDSIFFPGRPVIGLPTKQQLDDWLAADLTEFSQGYRHHYLSK